MVEVSTLPQSMAVIAGLGETAKTQIVKSLAGEGLGTYINLSLELARYLVAMNPSNGSEWLGDFMVGMASPGSKRPLILDHIEALFQPELHLNPLSWLLHRARELPLLVVWPGALSEGDFIYSRPNRPDYFRQRDPSVVVVHVDA